MTKVLARDGNIEATDTVSLHCRRTCFAELCRTKDNFA